MNYNIDAYYNNNKIIETKESPNSNIVYNGNIIVPSFEGNKVLNCENKFANSDIYIGDKVAVTKNQILEYPIFVHSEAARLYLIKDSCKVGCTMAASTNHYESTSIDAYSYYSASNRGSSYRAWGSSLTDGDIRIYKTKTWTVVDGCTTTDTIYTNNMDMSSYRYVHIDGVYGWDFVQGVYTQEGFLHQARAFVDNSFVGNRQVSNGTYLGMLCCYYDVFQTYQYPYSLDFDISSIARTAHGIGVQHYTWGCSTGTTYLTINNLYLHN